MTPVSYTHLDVYKRQGEEEKTAADLITKMDLFGGDSKGLYMLNSELKARVYTCLLYTSLSKIERASVILRLPALFPKGHEK